MRRRYLIRIDGLVDAQRFGGGWFGDWTGFDCRAIQAGGRHRSSLRIGAHEGFIDGIHDFNFSKGDLRETVLKRCLELLKSIEPSIFYSLLEFQAPLQNTF
jgi:hypothetical protein